MCTHPEIRAGYRFEWHDMTVIGTRATPSVSVDYRGHVPVTWLYLIRVTQRKHNWASSSSLCGVYENALSFILQPLFKMVKPFILSSFTNIKYEQLFVEYCILRAGDLGYDWCKKSWLILTQNALRERFHKHG